MAAPIAIITTAMTILRVSPVCGAGGITGGGVGRGVGGDGVDGRGGRGVGGCGVGGVSNLNVKRPLLPSQSMSMSETLRYANVRLTTTC